MYLSQDRTEIYHVGLIDYIQLWNNSKKLENFYKRSLKRADSQLLSAVNPELYRQRFVGFIIDHFMLTNQICPNYDRKCKYLSIDENTYQKFAH